MKRINRFNAVLRMSLLTLVAALAINLTPAAVYASGGGGGGGGGVKLPGLSGNWSGTITTSFGTGAFTMKLSQSGSAVTGSVHFGAPIFDSTVKLSALTADGTQFAGIVFNGEGNLPITGVMSPDHSMMSGTVVEFGQTYAYLVVRN